MRLTNADWGDVGRFRMLGVLAAVVLLAGVGTLFARVGDDATRLSAVQRPVQPKEQPASFGLEAAHASTTTVADEISQTTTTTTAPKVAPTTAAPRPRATIAAVTPTTTQVIPASTAPPTTVGRTVRITQTGPRTFGVSGTGCTGPNAAGGVLLEQNGWGVGGGFRVASSKGTWNMAVEVPADVLYSVTFKPSCRDMSINMSVFEYPPQTVNLS